ncbi:MAG: transporter substrate-binding domain-containing protein [Pseudomonadota bacterium]
MPPYAYLENGVPAGIDIAVARHVFGQLGVPVTFELEPFARCQSALKQGTADVGLAISNTLDRQSFVHFPKSYVWLASFVFFTNKATLPGHTIAGLDDARKSGLRIGIIRGTSYHDRFWQTFPAQDKAVNDGYNAALDPAADTATNLRKLQGNRIQLYPQDRSVGLWEAKRAGLGEVPYYDTVLFTKGYYNAFSRASHFSSSRYPDITALLAAYDAKLEEFKRSAQYQAIFAGVTQGQPK